MSNLQQTITEIFAGLPAESLEILSCASAELKAALAGISQDIDNLEPAPKNILRAFRETPKIKVVLLGQDPYPQGADGFSFSSEKIRPSLKNIFACLMARGLMKNLPCSGDLSGWAAQGVLLLNTALTIRSGARGSHVEIWKPFTKKIIGALAAMESPKPVFILLGTHAQSFENIISAAGGKYYSWIHPSPATGISSTSPKAFINCPCFEQANDYLESAGELIIDWAETQKLEYTAESVNECGYTEAPSVETITTSPPELISTRPPELISTSAPPQEQDKSYYLPGLTETELESLGRAEQIYIFTDGGAVQGSGYKDDSAGPKFLAAWGVHVKSHDELILERSALLPPPATNNRAELHAMIVGYLIAELALGLPGADKKQIYMCYDSKYAYTELTIPRAAVTTAGTARKNYDMIRPAHTWIRRLVSRVRPLHINSHQKRPEQEGLATFLWDGNDRADKLCSGLLVK